MVGAQCGLLPEQVLDMNLGTFNAVIEGYQDHLFDLKCIAMYQGYWSGYYSNAKHPKPLSSLLTASLREHSKAKRNRKGKVSKPKADVDVDAFIQQEERFRKKLQTKSQSKSK